MANRGLTPKACTTMVVPSYTLTFDVFGMPYTEPAMASIAKVSGLACEEADSDSSKPPAVHGVAYLLPSADYSRLIAAEGAGTAYEEIEIEGFVLQEAGEKGSKNRRTIRARTLTAKYPFRPNASPSTRYLVSAKQSLLWIFSFWGQDKMRKHGWG